MVTAGAGWAESSADVVASGATVPAAVGASANTPESAPSPPAASVAAASLLAASVSAGGSLCSANWVPAAARPMVSAAASIAVELSSSLSPPDWATTTPSAGDGGDGGRGSEPAGVCPAPLERDDR